MNANECNLANEYVHICTQASFGIFALHTVVHAKLARNSNRLNGTAQVPL